MTRELSKGVGVVLLALCCALASCWATGAGAATVCDTDPTMIDFEPTVDPTLLNDVLNLLGTIPIDYTYSEWVTLLFTHTLNLNLVSEIPLEGVDFAVTTLPGSLQVLLTLPAWSANMTLTVDNAWCRNCDAEYNSCAADCDSDYDACMEDCGGWPWCVISCGAEWTVCEGLCAGAFAICTPVRLACEAENAALQVLLDGYTAGLGFTSATVTQTADVCMTDTCMQVMSPLESTDAILSGFSLRLFPEGDPLGIGAWLNDIISGLVNWLADLSSLIEGFFVNNEGEGLLINVFHRDIGYDGCMPAQPVLDCLQAGCSTVDQPRHTLGRSANVVFYAIPAVLLVGLILWRRRSAG
ncbi:MAG: hypothetical protein AB1640_15290 [bacterium]